MPHHEDIINGTLCRHDSYLRCIISKAHCPADRQEYEALKQSDEKWKEEFFWKTCRL